MNSYLDFSRVIKGAMLIALVSMLGACATGPKVIRIQKVLRR